MYLFCRATDNKLVIQNDMLIVLFGLVHIFQKLCDNCFAHFISGLSNGGYTGNIHFAEADVIKAANLQL